MFTRTTFLNDFLYSSILQVYRWANGIRYCRYFMDNGTQDTLYTCISRKLIGLVTGRANEKITSQRTMIIFLIFLKCLSRKSGLKRILLLSCGRRSRIFNAIYRYKIFIYENIFWRERHTLTPLMYSLRAAICKVASSCIAPDPE